MGGRSHPLNSLTHQGVEPRDARELLERGAAIARLQNHHLGGALPSPSSSSSSSFQLASDDHDESPEVFHMAAKGH